MLKLPGKDLVSMGQADQEALIKLVRSLNLQNPICVEIGSYVGTSANALLRGGARHVYCIDLWNGCPADEETWKNPWLVGKEYGQLVLDRFINNVPLLSHITPLVGESTWWAQRWPFKADLIFIDGNHNYEYVLADIKAWWPNLKSSGILCGHDYCDNCPGVIKAVNEVFPLINAIHGWSIWSVIKA